MTEPNPYHGGTGEWGPGKPPEQPPTTPPPGYGYPNSAPRYSYPQKPAAPAYGYPEQSNTPAYGFPQQLGAPTFTGGAPVLAIGDITVMGDQIITPAGTMPLRGAVWNATDMSHTEEKIPTVAIVLASSSSSSVCSVCSSS